MSRSRVQAEPETAAIIDTMLDGRGVADAPGKKVFVDDALTGETVKFRRRKKRRNYDEAELLEVITPAPERIEPRCEVFGVCGGCSLQHLSAAAQLNLKQSTLLDNLKRIGKVTPERILEPLQGSGWGYRRKARLAVKHVFKKGRVLVGFRERNKPYVANMQRCETLHPSLGDRLEDLSALIGGLSIHDRLPQIECAVGDNATAMIFRVLDQPSEDDLQAFAEFGRQFDVQVFLQTGGPNTVMPLPGESPEPLAYRIPDYDVAVTFTPTDFLQVHGEVNLQMIRQALELLEPQSNSKVLDFFCGLGNFSLPLARTAGQVVAMELAAEMVQRARTNAQASGLENISFMQADLTQPLVGVEALQGVDRVLLDPPRTGAAELIEPLLELGPERIVYVSCHPGTLARDAGRLVNEGGYRLAAAGVMDMFPQTSHVESMALFQR